MVLLIIDDILFMITVCLVYNRVKSSDAVGYDIVADFGPNGP
jgi:hypothetical protein